MFQHVGCGAAGIPHGGLAGLKIEQVSEYLCYVCVDVLSARQLHYETQRLFAERGARYAGQVG